MGTDSRPLWPSRRKPIPTTYTGVGAGGNLLFGEVINGGKLGLNVKAKAIATFSTLEIPPLLGAGFSIYTKSDLVRMRGPFVQAVLFAKKRSDWPPASHIDLATGMADCRFTATAEKSRLARQAAASVSQALKGMHGGRGCPFDMW